MKAIRVHECGGPEVLRYEDVPVPEPKKGEARVRIEFAGINYIDIYNRSDLYPLPTPFIPGMEGSGVVDALGSDVSEVKKGDRVVSSGGLHGVVTGLTDDVVTMEIAPKVRVKVSRGSIAGVMGKTEA